MGKPITWVLLVALVSQSGCGIAAATAIGYAGRHEERYALRPDLPEARLYCDGKPCAAIRGTTKTWKESPWAFAVAAAAEGSCAYLASGAYHRSGSGGMKALADGCGFLFVWDVATVPLAIPLDGMFVNARHETTLDGEVELSWQGATVPIYPWQVAPSSVGALSVAETWRYAVGGDTPEGRRLLCQRLYRGAGLRPDLVYSGEDSADLRAALAAALGPFAADGDPPASFHLRASVAKAGETLSLDLQWLGGTRSATLARASGAAPSEAALVLHLPALAAELRRDCGQ